jgi:hypothetical protein
MLTCCYVAYLKLAIVQDLGDFTLMSLGIIVIVLREFHAKSSWKYRYLKPS